MWTPVFLRSARKDLGVALLEIGRSEGRGEEIDLMKEIALEIVYTSYMVRSGGLHGMEKILK
jgi:hypothetical protein